LNSFDQGSRARNRHGEWAAKPSGVADHPAPEQLSSVIIPASAVQNHYNRPKA
jgi:hypothetical protein